MENIFKYKRLLILTTITLILAGFLMISNASASISPNYVTRTLFPGDCYTITKTVTIPDYTPKADVVFAFDLTGSMSGIINTAKINANTIMSTLITNYPTVSFNFGVMSYMDYPHYYSSCGYSNQYGNPSYGDYAYSLDQSLTPSTTAVSNAINALVLGDGQDLPQDYTRIFYESYADPSVGWRSGAKRLLVNFADDVPHDCNLNEGVAGGTWSTGLDPGRNEIAGDGDDLDLQTVLSTMAAAPNSITLIECHTSTYANAYWTYWTGITGGNVYITSSTTLVNDVVTAVVSGITIPTINNLHLEVTTPGYSSWLFNVVPPSYATVNPGDTVTFDETICVPLGTPCGVHTFTVSAVDATGVSYGDQINEITIPCDTTPPVTTKDHGPCVFYDPTNGIWYMKPCNPIYLYSTDSGPQATGVAWIYYEVQWDIDCDGTYDVVKFSNFVFDNDPEDQDPIVGEIFVELHIDQECCHKLIWYAMDYAGNLEIEHEQFYRLDDTPPASITKTHPDPCYIPISPTEGLIKVGADIILQAIDGGTPPCISGIGGIYWGFELDGIWHPIDITDTYYGNNVAYYKDGKWWYEYTNPIEFHETCKHVLEYWAIDNVCNIGPTYSQIYWVNICRLLVEVDDNFHPALPDWLHTKFVNKQMALEWLGPGGTALMYDGIYGGDISIDDVPCCDNTGITQMGEYGCYPANDPAVITGSETIKVDDVTIKYLEYTPNTNGAIIVDPGVSGTTLICNKFNKDCNPNAIGVNAQGGSVVNARLNWWGRPDGPNGGIMDDGKTANGQGVQVLGNVLVEPWLGVHAEIANPIGPLVVEVGKSVLFDSTGSFAITYGECCQEPEELPIEFLWDFDDGAYSMEKQIAHVYGSPGTYKVSLRVQSYDSRLWGEFMFDWDYLTITVTSPGAPLSANADGNDLGGYETTVDESVQLYGLAVGGTPPYTYSWEFGDGKTSNMQNPTHIYETAGTYTATLIVTDDTGETASDTTEVTVHEIGELVVNIIADKNTITNLETLFTATVTGGVEPYSYSWEFGDGTISTEENPTHEYKETGTYTITLTVTDNDNKIASGTAKITVEEGESDLTPAEIKQVTGGFGIKAIIAAGDTDCDWSININGKAIISGGESSGTILANSEETIRLPLTIAFSKVDVVVIANEIRKEYTAFALGPFYLNLQDDV